jgi:YVTN family beta-propeller protein
VKQAALFVAAILRPVRAPLLLIWSVLSSPASVDASNTAHDPQLFVLTTFSNSVTVIDSATDQITTKIPVGQSPVRLAMTPDGLKTYISNTASNTVSVIDTLNRIVTATIPTGHNGPQEITVTPDGGRVFVVHQRSGDVAVIDTATDTLIRNVAIDGTESRDVLATPDGWFVYVANYSANEVSVIDTMTYLVTNIATPAGPAGLPLHRAEIVFS